MHFYQFTFVFINTIGIDIIPLLHLAVPLNDGNCYLAMPVVKGRYAHDTATTPTLF